MLLCTLFSRCAHTPCHNDMVARKAPTFSSKKIVPTFSYAQEKPKKISELLNDTDMEVHFGNPGGEFMVPPMTQLLEVIDMANYFVNS